MEKTLKFNSQIATSRVQSERLLNLGLKKETADCMYITDGRVSEEYRHYDLAPECYESCLEGMIHIPAWSLHRLIEMINLKIQFRLKEKATVIYNVSHLQPFQSFSGFGIDGKSYYNSIINAIEWLIKEGYFNKDYLEEK